MSKTALSFIGGIFMLLIGLYLTSQGMPSDEVDVVIYAGNEIVDSINQTTTNSHELSETVSNAKLTLKIISIGSTIIGIITLIIAGIEFFKQSF